MVTLPAAQPFGRLLAELPRDPGAEVILHRDGARATATMRTDGHSPRAFLATPHGARELLPSDDERLPGRSLLADPEQLAAALEPHTGPIAGSRVVAWRPGRRAAVQVTLRTGATIWLKLLDAKGWQRASRAFDAVSDALSPMHLCLPELRLQAHCGYTAAPARGTSLRTLLAEGGPLPLTAITRGLLALAYTQVRGELPVLDFEAARTAALDMLAKGAAMRPELAELAARLAPVPAPTPPPAPGFVHGDLHDKQLFVHEHGTSLIDLEGMAIGDPRFDLANLAEHVRLRDLQQTGRDQGLADVVIARCGLHPDAPETRAFRAVVRARLCGVYALRPRWRELVDRLCTETATWLDELT